MILICDYLCKLKNFLEYLKFIFYGLIQGLTEFIPVSSTAHLKIISIYFGIQDPGSSLSAIIQIGSVLAILWYFRNEIYNFCKKSNSTSFYNSFLSKKLIKSIYIGTIPIIFTGGMIKIFHPEFSVSFFRSNFLIALVSILMSFLMLIADNSSAKFINLNNHKYLDSVFIGIAQSFAIIPGVSRSGATISMALFLGWDRKNATNFSFLLGIPAISLASLLEFWSSFNEFSNFPFYPLLFGLITTFFSSLIAINFLIKYLSTQGLKFFIYYRLIFGTIILLNL